MKRVFAFVLGAAALCASGAFGDSVDPAAITWSTSGKRVLLIQPDVELGELTVGGVIEPRADWSTNAARNIESAVAASLGQHGIEVTPLEALTDPHEIQLAKLHGVVGIEILIHELGLSRLPTKKSALDWTLGPGTNGMHAKYRADYGMFVVVRDTYSSDTRKALMMLGFANGGTQIAFASLVDLRTGNIVWFNRLLTEFGGDLREPKGATEFSADLLKGAPL